MDYINKEVLFDKYCDICKYKLLPETDHPCDECLESSANEHSHKPVKWELADGEKDPFWVKHNSHKKECV